MSFFHDSNFLAPKLSYPTIKDSSVLCLIIGGFSFRRMLDNTRLLKTKSWHRKSKLFRQQRRLWVKLSHPGCNQARCSLGTRLQWRNSSSHGLGHGYAGAGLHCKHQPAAGQSVTGNPTQLAVNFKGRNAQENHTTSLPVFCSTLIQH